MTKISKVLVIAGSDPSGGAGLQADLRVIALHDVYGAGVITCLTAQNTQKVYEIFDIPIDFLRKQIDVVLEDIQFDAIKIGMLSSVEIIDCVALALKSKFPQAQVYASDVSKGALKVSQKNAAKNNLEVQFIENDILLSPSRLQAFPNNVDVIVSNPPYVLESDKKEMSANVLQYEPHLALFVEDENAIVFYKKIGDLAFELLNAGGKLYFEIHENKALEVQEYLQSIGFTYVQIKKDIYEKDRFVSALKH